MRCDQISYWFSCLTTETEKYVNENNYIVNLVSLKHTVVSQSAAGDRTEV